MVRGTVGRAEGRERVEIGRTGRRREKGEMKTEGGAKEEKDNRQREEQKKRS